MKDFECLRRPHAVDGSHSGASSKRLTATGGDTNQNASSNTEDVKEIAAGTQRSDSFLLTIQIIPLNNAKPIMTKRKLAIPNFFCIDKQ
eukprot:6176849-Pleurochrysis_carterae.AAC.2